MGARVDIFRRFKGFNPLLRNSLRFITRPPTKVPSLKKRFQPSLEEFSKIPNQNFLSGDYLKISFQPSLEEFSKILFLEIIVDGSINKSSFNPLLRNSLRFWC